MVKIDIFSGFLGAGKTTLIQKLIKEAFQGEKLVLIENEFGEIGIDGGFLKEAGIEITEMNSGCICCSLVGDFQEALKKVLEDIKPDRILIEPSGVGKLSDVISAVKAVEKDTDAILNHFVTIVDVQKCKMYMKNFGEFFNDQITYAKTIILSRTQNVSEKKINEVIALLKEKNHEARILTTPWDTLETSKIIEAMEASSLTLSEELFTHEHHHHHHEEGCTCGHHHEHEHHHEESCTCGHHHEHEHHHHEEGCTCEHHHEHEHHHEEGCSCGHHHEHHHHDHHADDVFATWGTETIKVFTKADLEAKLKELSESELYGEILRAKGIVAGEDTWYYFDLVPGEYEIREGKADYTGRLCVIGAHLHQEEIEHLFLGE